MHQVSKLQPLEVISFWFNELHCVIDEYKIVSEKIYKMDKSGFSISKIEATK